MSAHKLFTAIRVPEPLAADLCARVRTALGELRSFRIPRPDAFHLTLHFHGEVDRERVAVLADELGGALREAQGCMLELGEPGAFPRRGAARVLWVGVRVAGGGPALDRLHAAILCGTDAAGFDTALERSRPFQPHVTVARPRAFGRRGGVAGAFFDLELHGSFQVREVLLIESVAVAGAARRYETVRGYPLA